MKRLKPIALALDDDPVFRKALESVVARFGLIVKGVSTSDECLEQAKKIMPDVVLVDLELGKESGMELIPKIRGILPEGASIVVISGSGGATAVAHALESGANDFIYKPLDRTLLASKLARYVKTSEIQDFKGAFKEIPGGRAPARIEFDGTITEVDELGVRLSSAALIPKGTVLKLKGEFFATLGAGPECLVTVTQTTLDPKTERYESYAEFDGVGVEFLQSVRRWLSLS